MYFHMYYLHAHTKKTVPAGGYQGGLGYIVNQVIQNK